MRKRPLLTLTTLPKSRARRWLPIGSIFLHRVKDHLCVCVCVCVYVCVEVGWRVGVCDCEALLRVSDPIAVSDLIASKGPSSRPKHVSTPD